MVADDRGERALPAVIVAGDGTVLDVVAMTRKCYTKSIERGELWAVDELTGRVLPYGGGVRFASLADRGKWYLVVAEGTPAAIGDSAAEGSPTATRPTAAAPHADGALVALSRIIASRREDRPQGSYTSYLFDSGEEKIRKKTGEEAIEVILARDRAEMISESADLIYHLLVLLCQLDIPIEEVLADLTRRA